MVSLNGDLVDQLVELLDALTSEVGVTLTVDLTDVHHRVGGALPGEGGDLEVLLVDVVLEVLGGLDVLHDNLHTDLLQLALQQLRLGLGGRYGGGTGVLDAQLLAVLDADSTGAGLLPTSAIEQLLGSLDVVRPLGGVVYVAFLTGHEEVVTKQHLVGVNRHTGQRGLGDGSPVSGTHQGLTYGLVSQHTGGGVQGEVTPLQTKVLTYLSVGTLLGLLVGVGTDDVVQDVDLLVSEGGCLSSAVQYAEGHLVQ